MAAARRVLPYLPEEAVIRAKVYLVIKPLTNSFVFEVSTDPAIFLYLDPEVTAAKFANTVAHELHHIGYSSVKPGTSGLENLSPGARKALEWMGAFGEGFAMLAAAGSPDVHPHAVSPQTERARWDHDMENFGKDLKTLETFFLDVIEGRLKAEDEISERAYSFFGIQGPWYTVGYEMAVVIERREGRAELIECMSEPTATPGHVQPRCGRAQCEGKAAARPLVAGASLRDQSRGRAPESAWTALTVRGRALPASWKNAPDAGHRSARGPDPAPRDDRSRRDPGSLPRLGLGRRPHPLPGPGRGAPRAHGGKARDSRDAHRVRQVARRAGPALQGRLRGEGVLLHEPDQGSREREVLLPLHGARTRERRNAHRRREHQRGGGRCLLHGGGPVEHGAPSRREPRGALRRDGRVSLLRGQGARRRLAGAAPRPARDAVPTDVGDAGRHPRDRGTPEARHGPRGRARHIRGAAGAARLRVPRDSASRDDRRPPGAEEEPRLRRELHAAGVRRARAVADEREDREPRGTGGDPEDRGHETPRDALRQGVPEIPVVRGRRSPRRAASQVPSSRGTARPEGAPARHLRDRHARGRREHPDPDGPLHEAREVRRVEGGPSLGPRVQADLRAGGPARVRRPRERGRPGARAHRGEAAGGEEIRRLGEEGLTNVQGPAQGRGLVVAGDVPEADLETSGDARRRGSG